MASFLKNLSRFLGPPKSGPKAFLAAFGKHPGWNDHIDDLGLDTDELVTAKRLLYVQGINQNIDAAAWEKLEPAQRVDAFRHSFLWHVPDASRALIAGGIWSSVDGKGRDKYPIVLCTQTLDLPDNFSTSVALPLLARAHDRCAATREAATFRRTIDAERDALHTAVKDSLIAGALAPSALAAAAKHPDMHPDREGFHRIIYQIARGMNTYRPAALANVSRTMIHRPEQIRVPTCGLSTADALLFWLRLCLTLLDPSTPILLLAPDPALTDRPGPENGWVDILVGEPSASNLFCIKAKSKTLPLTSDIPYTLDPAFTAAVDEFIEACAAAAAQAPMPPWPRI